ncbi:hypothetical protein BCV69DRAFT_312963 [Microstroma glucosiphilum]|uniref:Vacuolar protein sorting-associated protein 51 homolog n=1 Tax=Pseudomicrostroma glucosiphilum TaxID=1684307 RepID=A0A316U549_9BASI|nr:hypothetical protein BCV69DRAFT_312963 [Pseudomicrostroma glucosiphilum]PWN20372.1 hypothetical protein BCV69DRAFT_312963 [Pseudomicrostroma glucosiphilum]
MSAPSATLAPAPSSRAERDRLRDYYGLASAPSSSSATAASRPPPPIDDPAQKYRDLVKRENISGLLKAQSDLLTEIRELDGDRQSLVYNHHTDLVSASETISKMKSHAESLSPTLATLASSFDNMSRLEAQLRSALLPIYPQPPPSSNNSNANSQQGTSHVEALDVQRDLVPIVTLPMRLRDLIALGEDQGGGGTGSNSGLAAAEALWGRHEAVLSSWIAQGVPGAEGVASECRAVLREQREKTRRRVSVGAGAAASNRCI